MLEVREYSKSGTCCWSGWTPPTLDHQTACHVCDFLQFLQRGMHLLIFGRYDGARALLCFRYMHGRLQGRRVP